MKDNKTVRGLPFSQLPDDILRRVIRICRELGLTDWALRAEIEIIRRRLRIELKGAE